jgi:heme exporter protein D
MPNVVRVQFFTRGRVALFYWFFVALSGALCGVLLRLRLVFKRKALLNGLLRKGY